MTALGACRAAEGGGEAMSEAKPGMWRPEAKRRGTPKYLITNYL